MKLQDLCSSIFLVLWFRDIWKTWEEVSEIFIWRKKTLKLLTKIVLNFLSLFIVWQCCHIVKPNVSRVEWNIYFKKMLKALSHLFFFSKIIYDSVARSSNLCVIRCHTINFDLKIREKHGVKTIFVNNFSTHSTAHLEIWGLMILQHCHTIIFLFKKNTWGSWRPNDFCK